ncbi:MAG: hypothetical protein ABI577_16880 [bacterium]
MGELGNGDNRTPFDSASYGDKATAEAMEGERRRAIGYRGKLESVMALLGAGMALVIVGAIVVAVVRAVL